MADVDESYLLFQKKDKSLVTLPSGNYLDKNSFIAKKIVPLTMEDRLNKELTVLSENTKLLLSLFKNDKVKPNTLHNDDLSEFENISKDRVTMSYIGGLTVVGLYIFYQASKKLI